jgi:hypothetical protein
MAVMGAPGILLMEAAALTEDIMEVMVEVMGLLIVPVTVRAEVMEGRLITAV